VEIGTEAAQLPEKEHINGNKRDFCCSVVIAHMLVVPLQDGSRSLSKEFGSYLHTSRGTAWVGGYTTLKVSNVACHASSES
jgi:hypothetical protein